MLRVAAVHRIDYVRMNGTSQVGTAVGVDMDD